VTRGIEEKWEVRQYKPPIADGSVKVYERWDWPNRVPLHGPLKVADVSNRRGNALQRARLIAAAPDLLAALEWILYLYHGIGKGGGPPSDDEWIEALDSGKTAIAKAKEESK